MLECDSCKVMNDPIAAAGGICRNYRLRLVESFEEENCGAC